GGLDDHGAPGEGGDHPVAEDEPALRGVLPGRQLADDQPLFGDPADQLGVPARVRAVDPAGQDGDGGATGGERAAVGGAVYPVGTAGDHDPAALGEPGGQGGGPVGPVLGAGPGADDRHRAQ